MKVTKQILPGLTEVVVISDPILQRVEKSPLGHFIAREPHLILDTQLEVPKHLQGEEQFA